MNEIPRWWLVDVILKISPGEWVVSFTALITDNFSAFLTHIAIAAIDNFPVIQLKCFYNINKFWLVLSHCIFNILYNHMV